MDLMVSAHTWGRHRWPHGVQPVRGGIHFKIKAFDCSFMSRSYFHGPERKNKSYKSDLFKGRLESMLLFIYNSTWLTGMAC